MRWRAAALCLAGGLCAASGAILAALIAGAGTRAWIPGAGALVVALALAGPLGFAAAGRLDESLRSLLDGVGGWANGHLEARLGLDPGAPAELRRLAEACNRLADDVTARLKTQRQLADTNAALAEETAELGALRERQRIAGDLHDSVSQRLFAIHLLASGAARRTDAPPVVRELEAVSREAQMEMRALLLQLRPPALAARPLRQALEDLAAGAERLGPPTWRVRIADPPQIGPAVEDGLYRIAQEAVANVQKHAEARSATLALVSAADRLELSIDDDGRGFSPVLGTGMGLRQMDERARALGGELRVKSQSGRGTRVEVIVPLLRPAAMDGSRRGEPEEALP